jgi:hypothetical protein
MTDQYRSLHARVLSAPLALGRTLIVYCEDTEFLDHIEACLKQHGVFLQSVAWMKETIKKIEMAADGPEDCL